MEEILASIRRILKEEEAAPVAEEDDVLVLDHSMLARSADVSTSTSLPVDTGLVEAHPEAPLTSYHESQHFSPEPALSSQGEDMPVAYETFEVADEEPAPPAAMPDYEPEKEDNMPENVEPPHGLMSEEASGAAANSIGALVRSISADRSVAVSRGGITIEDIVREEIRPLLKAWLDTQLPSLVERIVRSEIARVVDRSTS